MPPLPRLLPRTQKQNVAVAASILTLAAVIAFAGAKLFFGPQLPAVETINYTRLREIAEVVRSRLGQDRRRSW